ncbi:MAG TPA: 16S rRNA (uracil(1498)-N(3))-methyltransferase [Candidatus Anaerotruncus excrementipullorum]|uniref:Ribosomal RNA small subunit methyltransferase E n=1 Tax=Candidatus Anaerotruncus excrementipullorum TaxID=2838465 RepID=A0A9D2B8P8_9FIRM|nr:16S rRNA (uracil(1498)-N(3))-methyltransferase [Candidatus Anaerotruncus excrementipullorum]
MPRFFVGAVSGERAVVTGEDARHMALSLRMKPGEAVTVCDGAGSDYQCTILQIDPQQVVLQVGQVCPSAGEPAVAVTLYQALPKGDKMDWIVQKAVELGVARVVPVLTRRCVSRPDARSLGRKLERWNKIAAEAAKQCGRGRTPPVEALVELPQAVKRMGEDQLGILFYENASQPLRPVLEQRLDRSVSILVGSEGGFDPQEAQLAQAQGLACLSLGSRILRCETAPLAALAAIFYQAGEF